MEEDVENLLLLHACTYLKEKTYPQDSSKNDKRSIRRKAEKLVLKDGDIFYKKKDGNEVKNLFSLIMTLI